jgi:predicted DNA-binding antitoxin AbrB/MazE fold protein
MSQIEAVYRHGVFEPLEPVNLPEEQRVRLSVEPAGGKTPEEWLQRVTRRRDAIFQRQGYLPDSTIDIAEDRAR